jgi:hypothetical protein
MGKYEKPVPVPEFKPVSFLQFKFLKQSWTNLNHS